MDVREISIELSKVAQEEINEVPERIPKDIETLRRWINQTPHLRSRQDDQFLLAFLRGCKYSLEKAKKKLDLFYTIRHHTPELISNRNVENEHLIGMIRQG